MVEQIALEDGIEKARQSYNNLLEQNGRLSWWADSANVYDSLGEAYLKGGNRAEALVHYRKSLELDPDNQTAISFIDSAGFLNQ